MKYVIRLIEQQGGTPSNYFVGDRPDTGTFKRIVIGSGRASRFDTHEDALRFCRLMLGDYPTAIEEVDQ